MSTQQVEVQPADLQSAESGRSPRVCASCLPASAHRLTMSAGCDVVAGHAQSCNRACHAAAIAGCCACAQPSSQLAKLAGSEMLQYKCCISKVAARWLVSPHSTCHDPHASLCCRICSKKHEAVKHIYMYVDGPAVVTTRDQASRVPQKPGLQHASWDLTWPELGQAALPEYNAIPSKHAQHHCCPKCNCCNIATW